MAVQFRRMQWLASIAGACLCVVGAQADDWAQFRKDNRRSAASTDQIRVPLTEIWSYTNRQTNGHTPLFNCAVWKGRVFFVSCEGNARLMNCADARTGTLLWRRPLSTPVFGNPLTDAVAPAVSDDGVVYVYDQLPVYQCVGAGYSLGSAGKATVIDAADAIFEDAVTSILDAAALYFGTVGRSIPGTQPPPPLPPGYGALLQTMVQMARGQNSMITFSRSIMVVDRTPQAGGGGNQGRNPRPSKADTTVILDFQAGPTTCVRTFAASTGEPGPTVTIPKVRLEGPVQQLLFQDIPRGASAPQALYFAVSPDGSTAVSPVPLLAGVTGRRWMTARALFSMIKRPPAFLGGPEVMGAPLIVGREFSATNDDNMLVRWRVGDMDVPTLAETRIFHGTLRPGGPAPAPLRFNAFSPLVAGGYILGSDGFARMMAALIPGSDTHYEIPNAIGGAAGLDTTLYAGLGAPAGCRGIAAIEVRTGQVQWRYPAEGIPGEPASGGRQLPAHWVNPGVAVTDDAVFGEVNQSIMSLDRRDGHALWTYPLPEGTMGRSIVLSPKYLLVCTSAGSARSPLWDPGVGGRHELLALNRKTGKLVWKQATSRPGSLALSGGLMHLTDGALHTYAPAERTFRMAVNSSAAEDYRPVRTRREEGDGEQEAQDAPATPAPPERAIADATVIRLAWGESQGQMDAAIKERRTVAPGAALLLSLDRLDATRSAWVDAGQHPAFTEAWIKDYAAACGRLSGGAHPEFFEVLPEINVYLARFPQAQPQVKRLVDALCKAIHAASPATRVIVSFNAEVLASGYDHGDFRPFGRLELPPSKTLLQALDVASGADVLGLTTYPQAAAMRPEQLGSDYLLKFRRITGMKPLAVTRIHVNLPEKSVNPPLQQAEWLRRVLRSGYWLDAQMVAYPDASVGAENGSGRPALRVGAQSRPALEEWRDVLSWELVPRLTAALGNGGPPLDASNPLQ